MDLVNRLKFFLEENKIAISQFADKCRIPRPTLSQILNGRNKKVSDELITKIHEAYPDLSVLWLMFGEGEMVTSANTRFSEPSNALYGTDSDSQQIGIESLDPNESSDSALQEKSSEKISSLESAHNEFKNYSAASNPNLNTAPQSPSPQSTTSQHSSPQSNYGGSQRYGLALDENERRIHGAPQSLNQAINGELNFAAGYDHQSDFNDGSEFGEGKKFTNRNETPQAVPSENQGYGPENARRSYYNGRQVNPDIETNGQPAHDDRQPRGNGEYASIEFMTSLTDAAHPEGQSSDERPIEPLEAASDRDSGSTLSIPTLAGKKITNIVVFYSDNSFQSFLPSSI